MKAWPIIRTVFVKEARDILRDKRTLFMAFFIPLFLYPICVVLMSGWAGKKAREFSQRPITVALLADSPESLATAIDGLREGSNRIEFKILTPEDDPVAAIQRGEIDLALLVPANLDQEISGGKSASLEVLYKATREGRTARERLAPALENWKSSILIARLDKLGLTRDYIHPLEIRDRNVASKAETQAQMVGGLISYLVIFLSLIGCLAPAIDLGAGEKERHTLETLLTAPADFLHIVTGKLLVVVLMGTVSAALALVGMLLVPMLGGEIPAPLKALGGGLITPQTAALSFLIIVPQVLLIASLMLLISFLSRTAREASSLTSPILMLSILLLMSSFTPGLKLTPLIALIPLLNVSLALQEILAGTLSLLHGSLTVISLLVYSALLLKLGARLIPREAALFRI